MPTTPNGIWYPDGTNTYGQEANLAALASSINNTPVVANAAERDARFPTPVAGYRVQRTDTGTIEQYFTAYNSTTNPQGAIAAGWYYVSGPQPTIFRRLSAAQNLPNAGEGTGNKLNFSVEVERMMEGVTYTNGDFQFSRPIRLEYTLQVTSGNSNNSYFNPVIRRSTVAAPTSYTNARIINSQANTSNFVANNSTGEISLNANDILSVWVFVGGANTAVMNNIGSNYASFILLREVSTPPRFTNYS